MIITGLTKLLNCVFHNMIYPLGWTIQYDNCEYMNWSWNVCTQTHFWADWIDYETPTLQQNIVHVCMKLLGWELVVLLQGYLDEQFHQLEELQDDVSPNFVEEVVTLFFGDSSRLIGIIEQALWVIFSL